MEIDLLGRFAVRRQAGAIDAAEFGGRRVRELVRILAAHRGKVVARDALIEALWSNQLPADPQANLNVLVNRARRALGEPDVIQTDGAGYLLRGGADIVVDAELFEDYVARARTARGEASNSEAVSNVRSALDHWDEPLPEDAYADWARPVRDRLERLHQEALETGADALLATGSYGDAVALATQAVEHQPLREAAHLLLIHAYAGEGDQAAAIEAYLSLRRMLADELGVDPSLHAQALYERILRGVVPAPLGQSRHRPRPTAPPLVGRETELADLLSLGESERIALVSGRSGSGKSHLLDELCARSPRPVLRASALLPEREEPWSLARALLRPTAGASDVRGLLDSTTLTALADVLPEVAVAGQAVHPRSRRALVHQGLLRMIESIGAALVVVDDLQWADSSTLDLLATVVGRSPEIAMVLAYRPEEIADDSPVARFLADIDDGLPLVVEPGPLAAVALERLVSSTSIAAALAEHTDGTPFAVVQVVRILEREGVLRRNPQLGWDVVEEPTTDRVRELARAGQREAVWRQFERLPRGARQLLATLSLCGRPVPVKILRDACPLSVEDANRLLSVLSRSHLVRHGSEGFRVDHDLVAETIRDRLDDVERAALHQSIADALSRFDGPQDEQARHLAGAGDPAAAAEAYVVAATARIDRFAHREAEQIATEALALAPTGRTRVALLAIRADALFMNGDFEPSRNDLREAIGATAPGPARSRLFTRLAQVTFGSDDLMRAAELTDLALAEAGDDDATRARATYVRALVDMNLDRRADADRRFDEALALFERLSDALGVADIIEARAMTTFGHGDITTGVQEFDRAAKIFTDSGNLLRVVTPRSTRGHGLLFAGSPLEGLQDTTEALGLAQNLGYAEGEAMAMWHRAEVLVGCGQPVEALAVAEAGRVIARRIGHRGWTATTSLAIGCAQAALGDLPAAAAAYEESLRVSGEHLIMFRCWGHARLASVLIAQGRHQEAAHHVEGALRPAPALAQYEARLARCELAVRVDPETAGEVIADALELADAGGHEMSGARLRQLQLDARSPEQPRR